jgi:predicted nucleic acid-binding protein
LRHALALTDGGSLAGAACMVVKASGKGAIKGLDAADAAVVAEAVAGRADVLVSGDQDLLKLANPPIRIVSPRGLWEALRRPTR